MTLPDKDALTTYGGPLNNYSAVRDPTTDEDAAWRNKYACNVAMMTHTAVRAMRSFVGATAADPTDPVSGFVHDALWGDDPGVKPVVARTGAGVWTVTYTTPVSSELSGATTAQGGGVTHNLNFQRALAQAECVGGVLKHVVAEVTAANVVTVRGFLADGTPDDLNGILVTVWIW